MKITVITGFSAKRNMYVQSSHLLSIRVNVDLL